MILLKKVIVYSIEFVRLRFLRWQRDVKLSSYRKVAQIGVNFCQSSFNPLSGSGLLLYNRGSRESICIGDNVLLECKINCNADGRIRIGDFTSIRENSVLNCDNSITIGSYCFIGNDVLIQDNDSHPESPALRKQQSFHVLQNLADTYSAPNASITIGDRVWIGTGATILKGVSVGEGSIIGTGSIVTHSVPPMSLAAGNPARILRPIKGD